MAKLGGVTCLVLISMVVVALSLAPHADAAISCGQIAGSLRPCISYVTNGGKVPSGCCGGIKAINSAATTPADRRAACSCLKSLAGSIKGIKPDLAAGLPGQCGVNVGYPISTTVDCSKVN